MHSDSTILKLSNMQEVNNPCDIGTLKENQRSASVMHHHI